MFVLHKLRDREIAQRHSYTFLTKGSGEVGLIVGGMFGFENSVANFEINLAVSSCLRKVSNKRIN